MTRYIAFLRGINISGKNKVPMAELKLGFEALGYGNVKTYLNSGNVAFDVDDSSSDDGLNQMTSRIQNMIADNFCINIPVYIISQSDLADVLSHAPSWWGSVDKEIYDNLIFVISPATTDEIISLVGEPTEGLEQVEVYKNVILWSFSRKDYQKCSWWHKTACAEVADKLTIRTAGTVRKVALI